MLIGNVDMLPDMQQPIEVMLGTLLLIVGILHRLLKKRGVRLVLTVSDMEQPSSECPRDTRTKEADGRKTDTDQQLEPPTN